MRDAGRDDHRAYVRSAPISVLQVGPLCADGNGENIGCFFILESDNREDVVRFHEDDPLTKAGLYGEVLIHRWDKHIG